MPSPVLLEKRVDTFVAGIRGFAARNRIPIVQFERDEREEDVARRRLARFRHAEGVVLIGVAQEKVNGFLGEALRARRSEGATPSTWVHVENARPQGRMELCPGARDTRTRRGTWGAGGRARGELRASLRTGAGVSLRCSFDRVERPLGGELEDSAETSALALLVVAGIE